MTVWIDGLSVFASDNKLIVAILWYIFAGQLLIILTLRSIFRNDLTIFEYLSLGSAGWIIPWFAFSLPMIYFGGTRFLAPIAIGLSIYLVIRFGFVIKPASLSKVVLFALFLSAIIILRLAYVSKATFPSYFDSAHHYLIIRSILAGDSLGMANLSTIPYYHLGFHFLSAIIVSTTQAEITRTMLLLGQILLAMIPFSLFFLVRHVTGSDMAGWFTVIVSGFGWYMPAHAVDWGKYPALMSLGLMVYAIGVAYLFMVHTEIIVRLGRRWVLLALLILSILTAVFVHSRSIVLLLIVLIAGTITIGWRRLLPLARNISLLLLLLIIIIQIASIQDHAVLYPLFHPYLNKGVWITFLILILSIFAYKSQPQLTFSILMTMCLLFAGLFIPINGFVPGYENLTLLDRPIVEMVLFLPMSLLGGLGVAGVEEKFQGRFPWGKYITIVMIVVVVLNALAIYNIYPSDCCVIVGNDDLVALDWVANQLPVDARIGISSTELRVIASNASSGPIGTDAGIWITPLTGLETFPLPNDLDFHQQSILQRLCEMKIDYLFVGEVGQPFDRNRMIAMPEWYKPLLSMPKTGVYEITGCNDS
jgi:hypothetical protein